MWLLEQSVRQTIEAAEQNGFTPTAEQQDRFEARYEASISGEASRIMAVAGNSAEISIHGVLTKAPSFMAMLFGGGNTTYPEIISALAAAEQDSNIKDITLAIDSPGGHVDGMFDTLAAIQGTKKPIKAIVSNVAASAAYAIASQADNIVASNRATRFGSIGILVSAFVDENIINIASTDAPKKAPDVKTEEGKKIVRETLDAMHELFVEAIATGRDTTIENVNTKFGQGATLLADEAKKRGMIDEIAITALKAVKSTKTDPAKNSGKAMEAVSMTRDEFKSQHPDIFEAVLKEGVAVERDRVTAHLTMGEASGDMKTATKAITDGDAMTAALQAKYMAAGMNRKDITAIVKDGDDANAVDDLNPDKGQEDSSEEVAAKVEASLGLKVEA